MSRVYVQGERVRRYIIENVEKYPSEIAKKTSDKFGITRQATNKHLLRLTNENALTVMGKTRAKTYKLCPISEWSSHYKIDQGLEEHVVWSRDVSTQIGALTENVVNILHFGFTEMFNNAIDHSSGSIISVHIKRTAADCEILISDDGVGIFRKIQAALNLLDERHAVLELAKGKFTTDPKNHSGQGIFFTSRMLDSFDVISGGVFYSHQIEKENDWLSELKEANNGGGTSVWMKIYAHTSRTSKKIFDKFSSADDDYSFNKTMFPVELARYGDENLVSRSQAKRLLQRIELFKVVILDFKNVPSIGQAFADEIFRVFSSDHPDIELLPINANSDVKRMIERSKGGGLLGLRANLDLFRPNEK